MTLSAEHLRRILRYDPDTGIFVWLGGCRKGKVAGSVKRGDGRFYIGVKHRVYSSHRLAWLYVYGRWPDRQLDHINGDRLDNSIENLREVTQADNNRNAGRRKDNTSGVTGVHWERNTGKWTAQINANGKRKNLGRFSTMEEAIAARLEANREYGYHPNHGRAA